MQRVGIIIVALFALLGALSAAAQELPSGVQGLVDQAKKDGMTVLVISPPAPKVEAPADGEDMTDTGLRIREEVRRLIVTAPDMPRRVATAFEIVGADQHPWWLPAAILTSIGGILVGYVLRRFIGRWGREYFRYMWNPEPKDDAERIGYLLFRAVLQTVYTVVLFVTALVFAIVFDLNHRPTRDTVFIIVSGYCAWRLMREVVAFNLIAPDVPNHRMLNLSDEDAKSIFADMQWVFALAISVLCFSTWIGVLDLDGDANKLLLILASFVAAGVIGYLTIRHRKAVAGAILGAGPPELKSWWRRRLAASWHVLAMIYLVVATAVSVHRLLLGLPSANVLISAPAAAALAGLGIYAVLYLVIERFYRARREAFDARLAHAVEVDRQQRAAEEAAREEAKARALPGEVVVENIAPGSVARGAEMPVYRPMFKDLAQRAAGIAVTIGALAIVLDAWEIKAGERGNPVTAFMDTLVVMFIAWVLYEALKAYVDTRLADEGLQGPRDPRELEDEPTIHGVSRLGTLLPLLRNVLGATIIAIAGMIVLSNLGVDIAPLFAGAGVIGLAVGFGAQTLIRDIFSGGFFLFDDAFRKGEYIELGDVRGTVEKISLRSFQLRHHNGPLHTIPFGEIKQLTNYSRDWVVMKLPLRLTFDADVEKVRKLVKKLGQELLDHPEVGKSFLQPLKSQGVVEMDDSAMILRVKFMTKPGDQWQTRKVVYSAIQELFRKNGIRFANREVTVRIADLGNREPTPIEVEAAAAAGRMVGEAPTRLAPAGDTR